MKDRISSFSIFLSVCIIGMSLSLRAYSQDIAKGVTVELESKDSNIRKRDKLTVWVTVINNSGNNLYLVRPKTISPTYNPTTRELGISLDLQPSNDHYMEFPRLKKLEPNSKIKWKFSVPVSAWDNLNNGKSNGNWTVDASVGILPEQKLKAKLEDLGFSLRGDIRMTPIDYRTLQSVCYSNSISINIRN